MLTQRRGFVWLVAGVVFCVSLTAGEELTDEQKAKVDAIVARLMDETKSPGVSVAIGIGNELKYSKGVGLADVENGVAVTTKTRFRTASIAKSLTAVVVLSLAEKGKLDLDSAVQDYVPEYPSKKWTVTSRQLLGHLGGVRHYKSPAEAVSRAQFFSLKAALETFKKDPLIHEPGTKFRYTTFGYNLLGSVAEGAGQESFVKLLDSVILRPAGMKSTLADEQWAIVSDRTRGYMKLSPAAFMRLPKGHPLKVGQVYNASLHDTSMKIPGGGLLSTPSDLVRFCSAINSGKLLKPKTREMMWTRQKTRDGSQQPYGLGWRIDRKLGRKMVGHSGGQAGTSTIVVLFPETGACVAIMCNLQGLRLSDTAVEIASVFQSSKPTDYAAAVKKIGDAVRHEVQAKDLPAFSIALVDDQEVVWEAGFGYEDAARKRPATEKTVYRVGSFSKLFTDIAVLQLAEDGKLDLDAPVTKYLPGFAPKNQFKVPLTLRQMMSHQSGLVRESPLGHYFDPTEPSLTDTVKSLNQTRLVYKPNTKTKYSNAAIAVVGAVLESQLDKSHPERVRSTILEPLKMVNSGFVLTPATETHLATAWMRTYDGRRPFEAPTFLLGTGLAGNLYSTVSDLSRFLSCLFNGGKIGEHLIVSSGTLRQMTTPVRDENGKPQGFGLGFHIQKLDGYTKIGHGGAVYGFSTQLEALPQRKLGVAAVAALDGTNGVVGRLADYGLRLMIAAQDGKPLPDYPKTVSVPVERARALAGHYQQVKGNSRLRINELDGKLFLRRGVLRNQLRANSGTGEVIVDDEISFGTPVKRIDDSTIVVGKDRFKRTPDEPPKTIPKRWKGLVGEYGWDHNTLYILEDRGQLVALIEWFFYYPLTEVDDNTFKFPAYGLYHGEGLKFKRDSKGKATEVNAAEVIFKRREIGTKDGETFKIKPVKPIDQLRGVALNAKPPAERGEFRKSELIELVNLDTTIRLDIRYASTNNFTGAVFYKQPKAFMQKPAAQAVVRANARLKPYGLGLLVHDAYRPWHVTKMFWDATPASMKDFVANPANGSRHNRGCAVDLTLYDLKTGKPIQMVAGYDEFSQRSFPLYPGGTSRQRWYRDLLRRTMEAEGFAVYEFEWWHFDFKDWKKYRIGNKTFEELSD